MTTNKRKFEAITRIMDAKLQGAPEIVEHELVQYTRHVAEQAVEELKIKNDDFRVMGFELQIINKINELTQE